MEANGKELGTARKRKQRAWDESDDDDDDDGATAPMERLKALLPGGWRMAAPAPAAAAAVDPPKTLAQMVLEARTKNARG